MNELDAYFSYAEVAFAAYADFSEVTDSATYIDALKIDGDGLSDIQAAKFTAKWRVVEQYNHRTERTYVDEFGQEHVFLSPSGLSVTLFEHVDGRQVVAIRGTDDLSDISTDIIDIWLLGSAENQTQYQALSDKVESWMGAGILRSGFDVSGHSLGGFLAANLSLDYPDNVSSTYIYNAPGLGGVVGDVLEEVSSALSPNNTNPVASNQAIYNVVAIGDLVSSVGTYVAPPIGIAVEPAGLFGAHSIDETTDSLVIYSLLSKIDQSLSVEEVGNIISASPVSNSDKLEYIISAVGSIYGKEYLGIQTGRNTLYSNYYNFIESFSSDTASIIPLAGLNADQLTVYAQSDIAYRYALFNANPFVVSGSDALYRAHQNELAIYDPVNGSGVLTSQYLKDRSHYLSKVLEKNINNYNFVSGVGELLWDAEHGASTTVDLAISGLPYDLMPSTVLLQARQYRFGSAGSENIRGGIKDDRLYGMGGDDAIAGNGGNDYMEGGEGNDNYQLTGSGNTVIFDISGSDTYLISGSGNVQITDNRRTNESGSDRYMLQNYTGTITIDGAAASTDLLLIDNQSFQMAFLADSVVDNKWNSIDNRFSLVQSGQSAVISSSSQDLTIVLSNFSDGDFGILLQSRQDFADSASGIPLVYQDNEYALDWLTLNGTAGADRIVGTIGYYDINGLGGDDVIIGWKNGDRVLDGGDGSDYVDGNAGDDAVFGGRGSDHLLGGDGDDWVSADFWYIRPGAQITDNNTGAITYYTYGESAYDNGTDAGSDLLEGGRGSDLMLGSAGDDQLYGGEEADLAAFFDGTAATTNTGNDFVSGANGDDLIVGGAGRDLLFGGAGSDAIIGGNGDDIIDGDKDIRSGSTTRDVSMSAETGELTLTAADDLTQTFFDLTQEGPGNDVVYAGGGNDRVNVRDGNDVVYGGQGNDIVFGGEGADYLNGDSHDGQDADLGRDVLYGQGGEDILVSAAGNDTLKGGEDEDSYTVETTSTGILLLSDTGITTDHYDVRGGSSVTVEDDSGDDDYTVSGSGNVAITDRGTGGHGDIYRIAAGTGEVQITDASSKVDRLTLDGREVEGVYAQAVAGSSDYYLTGSNRAVKLTDLGGAVVITAGSGPSVHVNGFSDGDFGIRFYQPGALSTSPVVDVELGNADTSYMVQVGTGTDDVLSAGANAVAVAAGAGNDKVTGSDARDLIDGGDGSDDLRGGAGDDYIVGGLGHDDLGGGDGRDVLFAGPDASVASLDEDSAPNRLSGGSGIDILIGSGGDDELYASAPYDPSRNDEAAFVPDPDAYLQIGDGYGKAELGGAFAEFLSAGSGNDLLVGGSGYDFLAGGDGDDRLYGGAGNDVLLGDESLVATSADWSITVDRTYYSYNSSVTRTTSSSVSGNDLLDGGSGDDVLIGGKGDSVIYGGSGIDYLNGNTAVSANYLYGGAGDDVYQVGSSVSGWASTAIDAAVSNDYYSVSGTGNARVEDHGGSDYYWVAAGRFRDFRGQFHSATDYEIQILDEGPGADVFEIGRNWGSLEGAVCLSGNGHDEDTLRFHDMDSAGYYIQDSLRDGCLVSSSQELGFDQGTQALTEFYRGDEGRKASVNQGQIFLPDFVQADFGMRVADPLAVSMSVTPDGVIDSQNVQHADDWRVGKGSEGDETYVADGAGVDNTVWGLGGADVLIGADGTDILFGGTGSDRLVGNAGRDLLFGDAPLFGASGTDGDVLAGGSGSDVLQGADGDDRIFGDAEIDRVALDSADDGVATSDHDFINGGGGNDFIVGSAGDDTVFGAAGSDEVFGGAGDDLIVGDVDIRTSSLLGQVGSQYSLYKYGSYYQLAMPYQELINVHSDLANYAIGGADILYGGSGNDRLYGDGGDDQLFGGVGNDSLIGGYGNDHLWGEDGNDLLNGMEGDDQLSGGNGNDKYYFYHNSSTSVGHDEILDAGGLDELVLNSSLNAWNMGYFRTGNDLLLEIDSGSSIRVKNWYTDDGFSLESFRIGGYGYTADTVATWVIDTNPLLVSPIDDQQIAGGESFELVLPQDMFQDPSGNALDISVSLENDQSLPSWLSYDPNTGSISGLVPATYTGDLVIDVKATSSAGGWSIDEFILSVAPSNTAPELQNPIGRVEALEDAVLSFIVPQATFSDVDSDRGDTLGYQATLADGTDLPAWLVFDPATATFSGQPANGDVGSLSILLTATDQGGLSATDTFDLVVLNQNDAPVVASPLPDVVGAEDQLLTWSIDPAAFADDDAVYGDTLTFAARLADGSPLPAWLAFDAATATFSGTPDNADVGTVQLQVAVTDLAGAQVSTTFELTVNNVNDAPVVAQAPADQSVFEDEPFSIAIPIGTFADDDAIHGDTLGLAASLVGGQALPAWLSFDQASATFTGTPGNWDVGDWHISLTATDQSGASADSDFTLQVQNVNDVPYVQNALADRDDAIAGDLFHYTLPADTFADIDAIHGDQLALGATLADGIELPAWLSFDPATATFSGTPTNADADLLHIQVTATDLAGAVTSSGFQLLVQGSTQGNGSGTQQDDLLVGTAQDDNIVGLGGNDLIYGGWGDDQLHGTAGNNALYGGRGDDTLRGGRDNDLLVGGPGSDKLIDNAGDDTYRFGMGDGNDLIVDQSGEDTVVFDTGIAAEDLWFNQQGDGLLISLVGSTDSLLIENWYKGAGNGQIEHFTTATDLALSNAQVDQLVSAMASFSPTGVGNFLPSDALREEVAPLIAANWSAVG